MAPLRISSFAIALSVLACAPVTYSVPVARLPDVATRPEPGRATYEAAAIIDAETGHIRASWVLALVADSSTTDSLSFFLNRGLEVVRLQGAQIRGFETAPFEDHPLWNHAVVRLEPGVAVGSVIRFDVSYSGRLELPSDGINNISTSWVELNVDSGWHPLLATFDQEMTGELRVGLPPDWTVIASGDVSLHDGSHVVRNTVPQLDVAFAAAPAITSRSSANFDLYSREDNAGTAVAVLDAAEGCAAYLNSRYGSERALPRGRVVLAGRDGPGYARKNYIVISQVDPANQPELHLFLCHELAHFWTANAGAFSPHHWMSESFAEYVATRFLRHYFGEAEFNARIVQFEQAGRAHGPVWTPESTQRPSYFVMYRRGPYLLSRLEERIGSAAFDRFLQRYMMEDVRTTPELLRHLQDIAGEEAEQWFRQELGRGPG